MFADCNMGCRLWMHHSSLNWESSNWWPKLRDKCAKDCLEGRRWQTSLNSSPSVYTTQSLRPSDERVCQLGCNNYMTCMGIGPGPALTPAEKPTSKSGVRPALDQTVDAYGRPAFPQP